MVTGVNCYREFASSVSQYNSVAEACETSDVTISTTDADAHVLYASL